MKEHAMRLMPGEDLVLALASYCRKHEIDAAYIGTVVGSLSKVAFRKGHDNSMRVQEGPFEIVSCVGTLSHQGMHLHASVSDQEFRVIGGHMTQGCIVQSTAEVILIELHDYELRRTKGEVTGFMELDITELDNRCSE